MKNIAKKIEPEVAYQAAGVVTHAQGAQFTVRSGSADYQARRATSCLVAPDVGDRVLLSMVPSLGTFVLAVLERDDETTLICVEGDLALQVSNGKVTIAAKDGIDLVSTAAVGVTSDEVKVTVRAAHVVATHVGVVGGALQEQWKKVKRVVETVDEVAERVVQRFGRVYRFVAEAEQVRAQRLDMRAEKTMSLHAENVVATAEELVKVDGGQIHLG